MNQLICIGYGFMGSAVARAVRAAQPDMAFAVLEKRHDRCEAAQREVAATVLTGPDQIKADPATVVLAIKPQDLSTFAGLHDKVDGELHVVSVLAGTNTGHIKSVLGADHVVRLMPSLTADIAQALVGVSIPEGTSSSLSETARSIADSMGKALIVPEHLMHAVTAFSGSGIAYVFEFIHALALGATREGLTYEQALAGASQVVRGAAQLLQTNEINPQVMTSRVCSPAGTTVEGVKALVDGGLSATVMNAVHAAARRSRELEQQSHGH